MYNYLIIFIDNYIEKICKEVQISLLKDAIVCVHDCFKIISDFYLVLLTKWQVYALSIFWHQIS